MSERKPRPAVTAAAFESLEDRRLMSALPFTLEFDAAQNGTIADKNGEGTGFTAVQTNKNGDQYQAGLIDLDTTAGVLKLTTRGTSAAGGNSGTDNSLVNLVETDFDGRSDFEVTTKLVGGLGIFAQGYEQGGLSFGPDQDNYVKLVAVYHAFDGPKLEFADEYSQSGGGTTSTVTNGRISVGNWSNINSAELKIVANATAGTLTAFYRLDNNTTWTQVPHTITVPSDKRAAFFSTASKAGLVAFDKTDAENITVTYDRFAVKRLAASTGPSVTVMRPAAGATGVRRDSFVAVDLNLPNGAVDPATISTSSVYLTRNDTGASVAAAVNTTGGGDSITLTPREILPANVGFTFHVTNAVKDVSGANFQAFTGTFTTGTSVAESEPRVAFDRTILSNTVGISWTGATIGPDGNFYGVTSNGEIYRSTINSNGTLSTPTKLFSYEDATGTKRLITGLTFDTTQSTLTAYVSHGQYISPGNESDRTAAEWSGKITRFSGSNLGTRTDVVVNLPRSVYDHLNNQPSFGPDGRLYWVQASNTAMGAPDSTWGNRPEQLLSAAVLAADVRSISSPLDVKTAAGGTYDPYASGAKVKIYATGIRNGYDLIWTSDGKLYVPANGSAAGGNTPAGPGNSPPAINGVNQTEHDYLYRIVEGGYYGHPNPLRGEYVLNGGNPTAGPDVAEFTQYPVGTQPDANYRGFAYDFGLNVSPDGAIQYQSNGTQFGGALDGKLVVVRYSGGDDLLVLDPSGPNGNVSKAYSGGFGMVGMTDPLDVIQDPATGNLYVVEAGFRSNGGDANGLRISLLKPVAAGAEATVASPRLRDGALHFNDVRGDAAAGVPHSVTITNTGTGDLALPNDAFTITGAGATRFSLTNVGTLPRKLAPGQSATFNVLFTASAKGIVSATLTIKTNDAANPTRTISLRGLGTTGEGDQNEPSLQRILDLYELPIQTGDPDAETTDYPQQKVVAGSDEVLLQTLRKAGSGPVTVELLASMGTADSNGYTNTSALGYYAAGTSTKTGLFTIPKSQAQTVNPSAAAGNFSFDPSGDFGLVGTFFDFGPRDVWSEDGKNTWESNANEQRKLRFFPLKDKSGNVVSNAYVFAFEEYELATDQNDIVGIIRNVSPAAASPELTVENKDGVPFPDRLVFNRIRDVDPVVGNSVHDQATAVLRNTGSVPLTLTSASISNADFTILSGGTGGGPIAIAPGATQSIVIKFVYNDPTARRVKNRDAVLTLNTNDPAHPTTLVQLSGLWQSHSEEGNTGTSQEGNLNDLIRTFGWTVDVGPDTGKSNYDTGQNTGGTRTAVGQENLSAFWKKAGTGSVTAIQIAAFHQQKDPLYTGSNTKRYDPNTTFNWYYQSDAVGSTTYRKIFKHNVADGQSILPRLDGSSTALARNTFDPGSNAFGVSVDQAWHSDEARNTKRSTSGTDGQHAFRFYAVRDRDGNIVPNTYIAAEDNVGDGGDGSYRGSNFDYQDNVYLLTNVRPVEGPTAPKSVSANGSTGGVMLSWAANKEGNLGGYDVYRSDTANGTYAKLNGSLLTATSFNDNTLSAGQTAYYRVVAVDYHGTSGTATSASGTRSSTPTAPAAASGVAANATAYNRVVVTWADNSNNETSFRVERAVGGGSFSFLANAPANAVTFADTSAAERTTYRYRVVAVNATGESAASNVAQATTPADDSIVAAPTSLHTTGVQFDRVSLAWNDASDNETSFRVERRQVSGGNGWNILTNLPANTAAYTDATVTAETAYEYRVVAFNASGESPASNVTGASTPRDPAKVNAPAGLSVASTAYNRVSLTWLDTSDNETGFRVERATGDGAFAEVATLGSGATAYADTSVQELTSYRYRVVAFNTVPGESPASNVVNAATPRDPAQVDAPTNFRTTGVSAFRVALAWDDNSNNETGFRVERAVGSGTFSPLATLAADETTYADDAAQPRTSYRYRVVAFNASGESAASNEQAATTPGDPSVIAVPTLLAATAASYSQADLSWQDNADNETSFVVQRRPASGGDFADVATLGTDAAAFVDTGVSGSTAYVYRVAAKNGVAQSPWSAEATVTTPSADAFVSDNIGAVTGTTTVVTPRSDADVTVSGGDVGNTADALRFAHRPVVGDFDYRVRVDSFDKADPASAAGLMVRDGLAAGAKNVFLRTSGGVRLTSRDATNGTTGGVGTATPGMPVWLRLVRSGNTFTAYYGSDGLNWTQLAQTSVTMPQTLRLGVAVAGYATSTSTARFRDFGVVQQTVPSPVTGLSAAVQGGVSVRLTWVDVSNNEQGFRVERRDAGTAAWATLDTLAEAATQYVDATVLAGRQYEYRVVAFNDFGQNAGETVAADIPAAVPPPPAASGGGSTGGGSSTAPPKQTSAPSLNWSDSGINVERYRIERRVAGGEWRTLTSVVGTVSSLRDASAEPGVTYDYRVVAVVGDAESAPSSPVRFVTSPELKLIRPAATATAAGDTAVRVSWPEQSDGETRYVVQRRLPAARGVAGGWTTRATLDANASNFVDRGLTPGASYEYRVRAEGAGRLGAWSVATKVTTEATASWTTRVIGVDPSPDSDGPAGAGDVGNTSFGGATELRPGRHYDVQAAGRDVWGFEDEFTFVGREVVGDFDYAVRVVSLDGGDDGRMAGLMARASLAADSRNAFIKLRPGDARFTSRRRDAGQTGAADKTVAAAAGGWVRLQRRGDDLIGYASPDAEHWTEVGRVKIGLGESAYVGLAASAHAADGRVAARFRDLTDLRSSEKLPTSPDSPAAAKTSDGVAVTWADRSDGRAGFAVQRRVGGGLWETLGFVGEGITSYSDATATGGTTYSYRVAAESAAGLSPYTREVVAAA